MVAAGWFEFRDLFHFFRFGLAVLLTVYFLLVTAQWLWGWYVWLAGSDRYIGLLRRYLLVQGLRLRFRRFWADVLICILLTVAILLLWQAQGIMDELEGQASERHVQYSGQRQ